MMKYRYLPLIASIALLAACSSNSNSASTASSSPAPAATTPAAASAAPAIAADGAKVFNDNCSSCHGAHGQGMPGAFPPLAKNPVVTGDPKIVMHIVEYGLNGKISVLGQSYNGVMPAWKSQLSNAQLAAVISYVRSAWGNNASPVSEADIAAVKR